MPQVDLRPFLTPASKRSCVPPVIETAGDQTSQPVQSRRTPLRIRLTGPQLANIAFVAAACLGAVVSALYLITGGEVFQEVAAWPRELFYGRPVTITQTYLTKDGSFEGSRPNEPAIENRDSGDPFSPTSKLLNFDPTPNSPLRPNGRFTGEPFSTPSNLNRLNVPSPAGDALSRALMQGASDIGNATASVPNSAVATPQSVAAKAVHAVSAQTNAARQAGVHNAHRLSSTSTGHAAIKTQVRSQKLSGNRKAAPRSASTVQPQTSRGTSALPNHDASSGVTQSAAGLQSAAPIGHGISGGGSPGLGLGGGQSFGRIGGR